MLNCLLVVSLLLVTSALAQELQSQTIRGIVQDDSTSLPIAGAEVILRDSLGQTLWVEVTDRGGRFVMAPNPGTYSFEVLRMGYQPVYTEQFAIAAGADAVNLTVTLPNAPVILDPATVEGERQPFAPGPLEGFYERKRRGWGIQLDREEIEAKAPVQFTDILRNLPGVRVVGLGGNRYEVRMAGATPKFRRGSLATPDPCDPTYYVDGIIYKPDPDYGINEIMVFDVGAVEVYRRASETPAEFLNSDSRCGVVVIWTRRGG